MLKIIIKSIRNRKWSFLLTMLVSVVAMVMASFVVYIYENAHFCMNVIEDGLTEGSNNTGIISISDSENVEYKKILEWYDRLLNEEGVISIGSAGFWEGFEDTELARAQCALTGSDTNMIDYIMIEAGLAEMYNIPLEDGKIEQNINLDVNGCQVYLGSAFKNHYKIGDVLEEKGGYGTYRFEIKGFLKSGTKVPDPETLMSTESFQDDKCYKKLNENDVVIVFNRDELGIDAMFFTWPDSISYNEIKTRVTNTADSLGIDVIVGNLNGLLNERMTASMNVYNFVNGILWIVMIASVIMITCTQVSVVFTNLSEYGILCANGFSIQKIAVMLIAENAFKIILSGICSAFLFYRLLDVLFIGTGRQSDVCREIFMRNVLPADCIICLLIIAVSSIIPVIVLMNQKTSTLIGGNDT